MQSYRRKTPVKKQGRKDGCRHKSDLPLRDKILVLSMYYRMYTTYDMLGMVFDLDKSNVVRDIRYLEPAAKQLIPIPAKEYTDSKKITAMPGQGGHFPSGELVTLDGSKSHDQDDAKLY